MACLSASSSSVTRCVYAFSALSAFATDILSAFWVLSRSSDARVNCSLSLMSSSLASVAASLYARFLERFRSSISDSCAAFSAAAAAVAALASYSLARLAISALASTVASALALCISRSASADMDLEIDTASSSRLASSSPRRLCARFLSRLRSRRFWTNLSSASSLFPRLSASVVAARSSASNLRFCSAFSATSRLRSASRDPTRSIAVLDLANSTSACRSLASHSMRRDSAASRNCLAFSFSICSSWRSASMFMMRRWSSKISFGGAGLFNPNLALASASSSWRLRCSISRR
mmetsp:Transcript_10851/g.43737  ORF Transcript_10851/g.43737 Transcript_10851/m.43737 type:complete len:294 (-) Transcript_10851:224-1105(-)